MIIFFFFYKTVKWKKHYKLNFALEGLLKFISIMYKNSLENHFNATTLVYIMTANLKYFNLWNNQEFSYFRKQEEIVFLLHITSIKLWTQGEAPQINVFTVI